MRPIHLGIDHDVFRPGDEPRGEFLLYPARGWPHKNHPRLFEAFAALRHRHPGLELVLTSYDGPVPEGVRSLGHANRAELVHLYRTAAALVFPSLYEGFGQPPLEAMACGCPVACANVASLPEVVGDAARLFDPSSTEEIVAAVEDVLAEPEPWRRRGTRAGRRLHVGEDRPCARRGVRGGTRNDVSVTPSLTESLRRSPPSLHDSPDYWGLAWDALAWLEANVQEGMSTLETGAGASTMVFAARGARHHVITPDAEEERRIRAACEERGIDASGITFHIGRSHEVLPDLEVPELDLVLVDGAHGFPYPILDWWHLAPRLATGGRMLLDDAYLPGIAAIVDFARASRRVEARGSDQLPYGVHPQAPRWGSAGRGGCPGGARTHELRVSAAGAPCCRIRAHAHLLDATRDLGRAQAAWTALARVEWRRSPSPDAALCSEELLAVVDGAPLELGAVARARIEASNAVIEAALAGREAVYGLTTQVGHGKDELLTEEQLGQQQRMLVMTHSGGLGAPLPTRVVRAALTARVNGIARGGSGASMAAAEVLVAMVNAGVHPLVPETASVGAGDIGQLAEHGAGRHRCRSRRVPRRNPAGRRGARPRRDHATRARGEGRPCPDLRERRLDRPRRARCRPRRHGSRRSPTSRRRSRWRRPGATSRSSSPPSPRPSRFPARSKRLHICGSVLSGSYLLEPGSARSVQDALSFRVVPQVHGALREFIAFCHRAVEIELNSASDNPLVSVEGRAVLSNGNFQPVVLAVAFDALRVAVAHVGQLSERRLSHLWNAIFERMAAVGPPSDGDAQALFGVQVRYPAAAAFSELKQLAAPATLDTPPLDMSIEDHGTAAPLSVRNTERALDLLEDLLAVERMLAHDLVSMLPGLRVLGAETSVALQEVEDAIAAAEPYPEDVHRALRSRGAA